MICDFNNNPIKFLNSFLMESSNGLLASPKFISDYMKIKLLYHDRLCEVDNSIFVKRRLDLVEAISADDHTKYTNLYSNLENILIYDMYDLASEIVEAYVYTYAVSDEYIDGINKIAQMPLEITAFCDTLGSVLKDVDARAIFKSIVEDTLNGRINETYIK